MLTGPPPKFHGTRDILRRQGDSRLLKGPQTAAICFGRAAPEIQKRAKNGGIQERNQGRQGKGCLHAESENERKMITNFRRIPVLVLGAAAAIALTLIATPLASAEPALTNDEITFVTTLAQGNPTAGIAPIVPTPGHTRWDLAQLGHQVANDVRHGVDLDTEEDWFRLSNPTLTVSQVSSLVVTAARLWAPDFARWYLDLTSNPSWPAGAVPVPGSSRGNDPEPEPGIPPLVYRGKCDYVHNCVLTPDGTGVMPYIP
jgi:hypothetical protein